MSAKLIVKMLRDVTVTMGIGASLCSVQAYGQVFDPTTGTPKNWNDAANWGPLPPQPYPNAVDAEAIIGNYASGNLRINLNEVITLGSLIVNNPDGGSGNLNIAPGPNNAPTGSLIFESSTGVATFVNNLGVDNIANSRIAAPILLKSTLLVTQLNVVDDAQGFVFGNGFSSASADQNLIKQGGGILSIGGDSSGFLGSVIVDAGSLRLTNNYLSNAAGFTVNDGGQLLITGTDTTELTFAEGAVLALNGAGKTEGSSRNGAFRIQSNNAQVVISNLVELQSDSNIAVNGNESNTSSLTITSEVTGAGGLVKVERGTLVLTGTEANTFTGTAYVNAGTLVLAKSAGVNAIGGNLVAGNRTGDIQDVAQLGADEQIADTASVTLQGSGVQAGVFRLNGFQETVGSLASVDGEGIVQNGGETDSTLIVASNVSSVFTGIIEDGGAGALRLIKDGTESLTLAGDSTYSGGTEVNGGVLVIANETGSATGTGSVTVNAGGVLAGTGIIAGDVSFVGGTLNPGQSPGTLTLGSTEFDAASILNFELDLPDVIGSGVNDLVVVNGDLTLDGLLNISGLSGFGAGTYRLFEYSGSLFDNGLELGSLPTGFDYALDTSIGNIVSLKVSAVPEASSIVFGAMGIAIVAGARLVKQRKRQA